MGDFSSTSRYVEQRSSECDLDLIRSDKRRSSDVLYNIKQYHGIYHQSKNEDERSGDDSYFNESDKNMTRRTLICQILPNKLVLKKSEDVSVKNILSNGLNRRRASETYSPYGTRTFPSLRQRSPSIDGNLSMSINGMEFSCPNHEKSLSKGTGDDQRVSSSIAQSFKNSFQPHTSHSQISKDLLASHKDSQSSRQAPLNFHRLSLTAPQHSSKSSYSSNSRNHQAGSIFSPTLK